MSFPDVLTCLLCDTAALQERGKMVLTGFSGVLPHVALYLDNPTDALQMTFVLVVSHGDGAYDLKFRIENETLPGKVLEFPMKATIRPVATSSLLALSLTGAFPGLGKYRLRVSSGNDEVYSSTFTLAQGPAPVLA